MANLCIVGACGRMGRMVAEKAKACGFKLTGAVEVPGAPGVGENFYGVTVTDDLEQGLKGANVVIEFALPEGIEKRAELYAKHNVAAVIGTTAVGALGLAALDAAAQKIPIIHAPNFSLGVNLLGLFLEKAAGVLDASYDVEIVEMHHHFKKDAPSGTALFLADKVRKGRKGGEEIFGRRGLTGNRPQGEIAIHALRGGDVIGDHQVIFAGEGERVEFVHKATSRSNFAVGALKAAKFLVQKDRAPGSYTMADVIRQEVNI